MFLFLSLIVATQSYIHTLPTSLQGQGLSQGEGRGGEGREEGSLAWLKWNPRSQSRVHLLVCESDSV